MANDKIHDAVVQALKNDGWQILFLAIHETVYDAAFQQKATSQIIQLNQLKLLVVDVDSQEVVQWIR